MKVKIERSRIVKPFYEGGVPSTFDYTPLSVFDKIAFDLHVPIIYAYCPPTPSNAAIELGLRRVLGVYREWAGRLGKDSDGNKVVHLNDEGVRFVEASVDSELDQTVLLEPSATLLSLHPKLNDVVELVQVQITRFSCGSMVVGFTAHHQVADGRSTSSFLVAWGQATRGLEISPLPFRDRTIFSPRSPPEFKFEHKGAEYVVKNFKQVYPLIQYSAEDVVVHKVHFPKEFISKLKASASAMNETNKPFSTFESLVAHLWRAVTKARGLNKSEVTQIRIAVDGRPRLNPKMPNEYFGNLVLWAFSKTTADDLTSQPLFYAAKVIHEAIANVSGDYFKSFIDFANHKVKEEGLLPLTQFNKNILWPNIEVDSWLRFPFYELDFGEGGPDIFMPSFFPTEGLLFLVPSFTGDGSIEAFVPLFRQNLDTFLQICYSVD